jgi:hypothetical protein
VFCRLCCWLVGLLWVVTITGAQLHPLRLGGCVVWSFRVWIWWPLLGLLFGRRGDLALLMFLLAVRVDLVPCQFVYRVEASPLLVILNLRCDLSCQVSSWLVGLAGWASFLCVRTMGWSVLGFFWLQWCSWEDLRRVLSFRSSRSGG